MSTKKALEDKVKISEIISVVCLVLLLAPQVLQLDCIDQVKDLSTVSGFYGPGAYIAWTLTFTSTLLIRDESFRSQPFQTDLPIASTP